MIIRLASIFLVMIITACQSGNTNIPKGILQPDEMEEIIWDMMAVDEYAAQNLKPDSINTLSKGYMKKYAELLVIHGITQETLRDSYRFYQRHPDLAKMIFDSLDAKGKRQRETTMNDTQ